MGDYQSIYFNAVQSANKTKRCLGVLRRAFGGLLDADSFTTLYKAKCQSMLTYAVSVASPRSKSGWLCLERANRLGLRYISNNYTESYVPLLRRYGLKSISRLCFEHRCCLIYKYMHGLRYCPASPQLITVKLPIGSHQLRQRGPHHLQVVLPNRKRRMADDVPFYNGLRTWNALSSGDPLATTELLIRPLQEFLSVIKSDNFCDTFLPSVMHFYPVFEQL